MNLFDAIGLTAPVMFLYAYAMVSLGRWHGGMVRFHVLNLLGALAILLSLTKDFNLPVLILEICWGTISIYGIVKALRRKQDA
jgi:hypothetical protein